MINKFITKMRDPRERRLFYALFGGKLLGVAVCFLVVFTVSFFVVSGSKAHAQTAPRFGRSPGSSLRRAGPRPGCINPGARGTRRRPRGRARPALRERDQYHVGADHRLPRVFHAGRLHVP